MRTLIALAALFLAVASARVAAQDRVVLVEPAIRRTYPPETLPGAIREVEITNGGRAWSVVRTVEIPAHIGSRPVALADGRRIAWLASDRAGATLLVQYDTTTARASIVDVGKFDAAAQIVADPSSVRLFVVEPNRVVFIDEELRLSALPLPGPKRLAAPVAGVGTLILQRSLPDRTEAEVVVINTVIREVSRVVPIRVEPYPSMIAISSDGQRLYQTSSPTLFVYRLEVTSLVTGDVIARSDAPFPFRRQPQYTLQLDETRGAIVYDQRTNDNSIKFVAHDARTLAPLGQFGEGLLANATHVTVTQTTGEHTILIFARHYTPYWGGSCDSDGAHIAVVDGRTFVPTNVINLDGRCPYIVPLPARR